MSKLYEITGAIKEIENMVTDDGEIPPLALEVLDKLITLDLPAKLQGCCMMMKNFEAEHEMLKTEATRLAVRARVAEANADRLKKYMQRCLTTLGIDQQQAGLFKLAIRNNAPSLIWDDTVDPATLPDVFKRVTVEPAKKAMLDAHKRGELLPLGATVVQTRSLRVI